MADKNARRGGAPRIILGIVISLLVLILVGLGVVFFRVLTPPGKQATVSGGGQTVEALTWVKSMYGFGPAEDEQLLAPSSVAIAPDGRIFVTDPVRSRIMVFNTGGAFSRLLHTGAGGTQKGMFARPESIACDDEGNVYVADSWANKIIVFNSAYEFVREWPVDVQARGVAIAGNEVFVLDVGKVIIFDNEGRKLGSFGTRGSDPGQIDAYQGVASDGERIYVADAFNQRIQAFDKRGRLLWAQPARRGLRIGDKDTGKTPSGLSMGNTDTGDQQRVLDYDLPQDITFDAAGRLVVVDAFTFQLIVVDPKTGKILDRQGTFGSNDGEFFYPTSVAYDAQRDWFAVADTRNNRVQIVRIPGSGGGAGTTIARLLTSPYRYCAVPIGMLLLALVFSVLTGRAARKAVIELDGVGTDEVTDNPDTRES